MCHAEVAELLEALEDASANGDPDQLGAKIRQRAVERAEAAQRAIDKHLWEVLPKKQVRLVRMSDSLLLMGGLVGGWIVPGENFDLAGGCQDIFETVAIAETLLGEAI